MKIPTIRNRFLRDNIYLLLASLILLCISVFTNESQTAENLSKSYANHLKKYIQTAQKDFRKITDDSSLLHQIVYQKKQFIEQNKLIDNNHFLFIYKTINGFRQLTYWSTQIILPDEATVETPDSIAFKQLVNGYYLIQKKQIGNNTIIGLTPIKWHYNIASNSLKNDFIIQPFNGQDFEISSNKSDASVKSIDGQFLFSIKNIHTKNKSNNQLTVWFRLLSLIPLLIFLHFAAIKIYKLYGFKIAAVFLVGTLVVFRVITYCFANLFKLRAFELFDPSIYGSNIILRSLGDLLINALLFLWIINFLKNHLGRINFQKQTMPVAKQWLLLVVSVLAVLFVTYTCGSIVRTMVADSQIPFDVRNFFSLTIYSITGFLVLCCLAVGYYYLCKIIFFLLKNIFPDFTVPFFLLLSIFSLFLLSFKIGNITGGFELYELLWLLLFLLLIKNDLSGIFSGSVIISRMVFWLFFFSATIAAIIIAENSRKELRNRKHYAETIATNTSIINDVLLNTLLTDFRPDLIASKFYLFSNKSTAASLRDSLTKNNNVSSYNNKYSTKILVFDANENPLFNEDPISYNSITGIFSSQAKPTAVQGLLCYYSGYDNINYIAKKIIKDYNNVLLGYIFIVINPQNSSTQNFSPELFNSAQNNSLENSTDYAFAVYEKGKLVSSHNDYAFASRYQEKYFADKDFFMDTQNNFNELWYNAGGDKYVVIVKENNYTIELITLFSYLFCSFLILSSLSWFLAVLVKSRLRKAALKEKFQLTIKQQVHGTIIFFSVFSFLIIGAATILFFISRYENNNKETLSRTIKLLETELIASVPNNSLQQNNFNDNIATGNTEDAIINLSKIHGLDINLYSLNGDLLASSLPLPYAKGVMSKKMDPMAFYHLNIKKEIQYFQKEKIGTLTFLSGYIPVTDSASRDVAYLNIPYFISQTKLKEEISTFLITIITLNAFIFLIAGIVALFITNRITNSFSFISEKMKIINLGKRNESIVWNRNDEIGALVKEYNKMLLKLEESAAALAKSERESAWQEMAKQVAHEIKNPLTPMKLSMQFLQRAIQNDDPNIKELGKKVSATLVEQIDHLSQIAGAFSRFATIEKASPEKFNLYEALQSIKQLYEADTTIQFTWLLQGSNAMVYADKTHVNRILTNLILNGIQAVEKNKIPHIVVETKLLADTVEIIIRDNGSGISEEIQSSIFMPNFTTKSSGTGLGLAMCKRMAEQAAGDLRYQTSNNGTSFFITLPIVK